MRFVFEAGQAAANEKEEAIRTLILQGKKKLIDDKIVLNPRELQSGAAQLTPTESLQLQYDVGQYTNLIAGISNSNKALKVSILSTLANLR